MAIGLKFLTTLVVVLVVVIVGVTCLSVTLITTSETFSALTRSWALNIAQNIAASVDSYYSRLESASASFVNSLYIDGWNHLPSDLSANYSRNWTDFMVPAILQYTAKANYSVHVTSLLAEDGFWCFMQRNRLRDDSLPATFFMEWIEILDPVADNLTVGGFQFYQHNSSKLPYGPETDYSHTTLNSGVTKISLRRKNAPFVLQALRAKLAATNSPLAVPMFWTDVFYSVQPTAKGVFWEMFLMAGILADDRKTILGTFVCGVFGDRDIERILKDAPKSQNSEVFLVDTQGFIIATTRKDPTWTPIPYDPLIVNYPPGCSTTETVQAALKPPQAACRFSVETYPYLPLNTAGLEFATSSDVNARITELEVPSTGQAYAVSSQRITTRLAGLKVNVVAIVPASDLGAERIQDSIWLGVGSAIAVMCVLIGVALGTLHLVTNRLQTVQTRLLALAGLKNLNDGVAVDEMVDDAELARREENAATGAFGADDKGGLAGFRPEENDIDDDDNEETSWISEIANLEEAYKETARSMTNFTRYVSRAVVSELIISRGIMAQRAAKRRNQAKLLTTQNSDPLPLDDHQLHQHPDDEDETCLRSYDDLTVLFVEIEGFSNIWRMTNPEYHAGVCMVLHIYFKRMCRLIMGHGGIVDRFLGDSIMSYWGAPVQTEYHAHFAVLCALALLRETTRDPLKKIFMNAFKKQLKLRGGLASGTALVGTIETRENLNYTILGTPVTHAKHLQSFNKAWKTSMLMDQNTALKVGDMVHSRLLCNAAFEGEADIPLSKQQQQHHRTFATEAGQHRTSANNIKIIRVYEVVGLDAESRLVGDRVVGQYRSQNRSSMKLLKKSSTSTMSDVLHHDGEVPPQQLPGQVMTPSSEKDDEQNSDSERVCTTKNCDSHDFSSDEQDVGTAPLSDLLSEATLQSRGMRELLGPFGQQLHAHNATNNNNTMNKTDINNSNLLSETDARLHSDLRESMSNTTSQCLTRLLRWHFTRTNVESKVLIEFCHRFREAALLVIDQKFPEAMLCVENIQSNPAFEELLKNSRAHRESIKQLHQTAASYCKKRPPRANICPDNSEFFFLVNYQ